MDGDYTQAEHTYIYATLENIKKSIITEKYALPADVKRELLTAATPFTSAYAECVYLRTYSRKKPDGSKETWAETIIRVVEGTIEAYLTHFKKNGLYVDYDWLAKFSSDMARSAFRREWSPPGRGLYAMGTDHTRANGNAALNNCYACETKNLVLAASWAMDQLMCGGGVGFDCSWDGVAIAPEKKDFITFVIPDTRQGWVAAVELLLRAYLPINGVITNSFPKFDYSLIRPYGTAIKGFGGTASGPEPLRVLLERIEIFLDTYIQSYMISTAEWSRLISGIPYNFWKEKQDEKQKEVFRTMIQRLYDAGAYPCIDFEEEKKELEAALVTGKKSYGKTRLVVDIMNGIGNCVVSGNVRRSAQIAIGDAGDEEFLELKNSSINPERKPIMWMSNNTVRFEKHEDFEVWLPEIAKRIQRNGEPGFYNVINSRRFGRFSETDYGEDPGNLLNPCVTGDTRIMTDQGMKRADELIGTPFNAVVDGRVYRSTEKGFWKTGDKQVYNIVLENGLSVKATGNHLFLVITEEGNILARPKWLSIDDGLRVGDGLRISTDYIKFPELPISNIALIEKLDIEPVYDCTIPDIHCFSANGIIAHNCGEVVLQSFEPCTLSTICPPNCKDLEGKIDMEKAVTAARYATFYASTVTTIRHHWSQSNQVIAHNRRIGVSMTGISNVYSKHGYTYLNTLSRRLYKEIRAYNTQFASKAGIPRSIRVTTIKPEGSLSIILECNNGVHFPICQYAKRRIAISKTSDILQPLLDAGFPTEQSIYDTNMVYVIFPVEFEGRPTKKVSIFEQCCLSSSMQRLFSDNSVSFTGHFSIERESQDVERVLAMFAPVIKSMSMFPYSDDVSKEKVYQHMPFEEITKEEYEALLKTVKPVQWNNKGIDAIAERGCTNDTCSWN